MIKSTGEVSGYTELADILLTAIESGVYPPGSQIPTEMEMSRQYRLNRHTVRAALSRLANKGYIYRTRGRGTFVAFHKINYPISPRTRFSTTVSALGLTPGAKLVRAYDIPAPHDISQNLDIPVGERITVLEILRSINGIPASFTNSYMPALRFPDLATHAVKASSLYELFQTMYGVKSICRAWSIVETAMPKNNDMQILKVSKWVPILHIRSLACDEQDAALEYCMTRSRGDMYSLKIQFEKKD